MRETEEKIPVVNHLTRVGLHLMPDPDIWKGLCSTEKTDPQTVRKLGEVMNDRIKRVTAMMELMAQQGFAFKLEDKTVYCYSDKVEAYQIKQDLTAAGFKDREFQIVLEYARGWGML